MIVGAVALFIAACAVPEGDLSTPEGAHYQLIQLRAAGDAEGLWEMLDPKAREAFETWHLKERLAAHQIRTAYPKDDVAAALAAMADGARADLANGKALFVSVMVPESPDAPGFLMAIGARIKDVAVADGEAAIATVSTYGGDAASYIKGSDARWYVQLPADEMQRLLQSVRRATANLARVQKNLAKLKGAGG